MSETKTTVLFTKSPAPSPENQEGAGVKIGEGTGVKIGELVQIRQHETLSTETKNASATALQPAESDHWIYARVLPAALRNGRLRVRVEHPANREHDVEKIVAREDYRTKDDVAALAEQTRKLAELRPSTHNNLLAKHFTAQHEKLAADAEQASA